jgi:hypothetical protein
MHPPKYQPTNTHPIYSPTYLPTRPIKQEASIQSYDVSDYTPACSRSFDYGNVELIDFQGGMIRKETLYD